MEREDFFEKLESMPIIAAIKDRGQIEAALNSQSEIIFLLTSDLFTLKETVEALKNAGKMVFVHFDLVDGLSKNSMALKYIAEYIQPDGIISTKTGMITAAKKLGLLTIQRHFVVDSISLQNSIEMIRDTKPDAVEILPGLITKVIHQIKEKTQRPIIAGGLISDKEDVIHSLNAGVTAISTTNVDIWDM